MKKVFLFLLVSVSSYNLLAQKTINDPNAEVRDVKGFHGIHVSTGIRLIISEGSTEQVVVSANKTEYRDKIITRVEKGILKIYYENKFGAINEKNAKKVLKAYVSYKMLNELYANTGAQVEIEGSLKSAVLNMRANTGAIIKGAVQIDDLAVDQNTGSVITLEGSAVKLEVDGDTGSIFRGSDLKTDNCSAKASTGAGVYITVQKELSARTSTGGFVKYKGDAGIKDIKNNTGGSVSRI